MSYYQLFCHFLIIDSIHFMAYIGIFSKILKKRNNMLKIK
ncbi:hypothetical protein ANASTE_01420 [Anaerofustis stercorihominis DSM 17244]|uniref:Uncharacterized protein n=1 Tax=Anaerofustis stercorihominis DSM 17244 TaxID=445971 RepID=B1CBS1_9FIRM|nr:hypothetical protein ANASTE_01420 [Anaerofustis stercorihominis DSM 17244]